MHEPFDRCGVVIARRGLLTAATGLAAMAFLALPGASHSAVAQDATPAATVTSDQGAATTNANRAAATETPAPAASSAVGGATTTVPRAGVGPGAPVDGGLASLLGVAAAAAAVTASLLRERKPASGR